MAAAPQGGYDGRGDSCLIHYLQKRLPNELFFRMTEFMDDKSLLNFRFACRDLELALLPSIQRRFFTKRHICLNETSLRDLSAMSDQPKLASSISSISVGCIHTITLRDNQRDDSELFIDCGYDVDMLTHAFSNMPRLQDVNINYTPFFSRLNTSSDMAAALARDKPCKLLRKLLRALANSGRELQNLDLDHHGGTGGGFPLSDLHMSDSLFETLSGPLRSVTGLTLALDPAHDTTQDNYTATLVRFLGIPRALKRLRLNFDRDARSTNRILEILFRAVPPPMVHLTQLDLGKMTTTIDILVGFIRALAKTLTKLQFFRIGLRFNAGHDYPPDHDAPEPTGDPPHIEATLWKIVFQKLASMSELERLTKFYAGFLTERLRKDHVAFRHTSQDGDSEMRTTCEYVGVAAHKFLGKLCGEVVIPSPRRDILPWVLDMDTDEESEDDISEVEEEVDEMDDANDNI